MLAVSKGGGLVVRVWLGGGVSDRGERGNALVVRVWYGRTGLQSVWACVVSLNRGFTYRLPDPH